MTVKLKTSDISRYCAKATLRTPQRGFSLVELLVSIATVALLLSILMPSLGRARSTAMRLACAHNLKQISLAVHFYLEANNDTYPCADDPLPGGY